MEINLNKYNHTNVDPIVNNIRNTFWQDLDFESLRLRYLDAPQSEFMQLSPTWDYSENAMYHNECDPKYLSTCGLYIAKVNELIPHLLLRRDYTFERFWNAGNQPNFLRIIGLWQRKIGLPPPVLQPSNEGILVKLDGFHRLSIAVIAGANQVPFYCNFIEVPEYVETQSINAEDIFDHGNKPKGVIFDTIYE